MAPSTAYTVLRALTVCKEDRTDLRRRLGELRTEKANLFALKRRSPDLISDDEFRDQKAEIDQAIANLEEQASGELRNAKTAGAEALISAVRELLESPAAFWNQADVASRIELQRFIFPDGLSFDGEQFGTARISLIYGLKEESRKSKSNLVPRNRRLLESSTI